MPTAGIHRLATANLTLKKKKGKALTAGVGEAFAPTETLRINSKISKGDPSGGLRYGKGK